MPARKKPASKPAAPVPVPPTSLPVEVQAMQMEQHLRSITNPGHVSPSAVLRMKELIPPETVVTVVAGMLTATRWAGFGENEREVEDWRTREAGAKLFLAYTEGLPIQRQEILTREIIEQDDPVARAAQSPATRRAIARTLEAQLEAIKAMDAEPETPDSK